jgi:CBS domain containing-hemolysin-like protein
MLHPLRQSRTLHTLTTGPKFGVHFKDKFITEDLRFEVVDMDQNRVDKLIVRRMGGGADTKTA